ncbi:MAG: nicotinate (nicotinamide) nucleotide adenylyltransferase [Saccharofermentanales bacterium]
MKIGIFGGTFDPIHIGHVAILEAAARSGYLDMIMVIPNAYPPHKPIDNISMASYRYEMVRIALESLTFGIPVVLSDIELFRKGISYTLDTINELKTRFSPDDEFVLIYGSDVAYEIENWYKPQQIMDQCELFLAGRPGFTGKDLNTKIDYLRNKYQARIRILQAENIDISSKEIKEYFIDDPQKAAPYLLPALYHWLTGNEIYANLHYMRLLKPETFVLIQEYECAIQKILDRERIIHSVNTMIEAMKLSEKFRGDTQKSAIAGLIHDCAKTKMIENGNNEILRNEPYLMETTAPTDIIHAYIGRTMAIDEFRIYDTDILNAVYYHTTSRANSSLLEKIIFVADKIEPSRTFPGIEEIRVIAHENLDEGLWVCLRDIIRLLYDTGKTPHPDTIEAFESISKEKEK